MFHDFLLCEKWRAALHDAGLHAMRRREAILHAGLMTNPQAITVRTGWWMLETRRRTPLYMASSLGLTLLDPLWAVCLPPILLLIAVGLRLGC
jgi:hypothetical protein